MPAAPPWSPPVRRMARGHRRRRRAALATLAAVAASSALGAACGDGGGERELAAVEGPASPRLEVRATEMAYEPSAVAVEAGEVEVVLHNEGAVVHDLHIGEEPFVVEAGPGDTATDVVTLEPGRYEMYCALPGHRAAGMEGVLEVR